MQKRAGRTNHRFSVALASLVLICGIFASFSRTNAQSLGGGGSGALSAASAVLSFGGIIISQPIPCTNGGLWMQVLQPVPKQPSVIALIWTPGTRTYLWGPPRSPGQWVLGTYDVPYACTQGPHLPILPGFRMRTVGTSPTVSAAGSGVSTVVRGVAGGVGGFSF